MLYDNYQSYTAAFCFAAVPEIIGALMMVLIPYYTRNQVNYRRDIGFSSNSGILAEDGVNVTTSSTRNPENPTPPALDQMGNYNVIINFPVPSSPSNTSNVNVIIKKIAVETNPLEGASMIHEGSSHYKQVTDPTKEILEQPSRRDSSVFHQNTAFNTTESVSAAKNENIEYLKPATNVSQELVTIQPSDNTQDDFSSLNELSINILTCSSELTEIPNDNDRKTPEMLVDASHGYVPVSDKPNADVQGTDTKIPDPVLQNDISSTVPSNHFLSETILDVPIRPESDTTKPAEDCLNNDLAILLPQMETSDKSIPSINSSVKINTPSNAVFVPVANEEVQNIINLSEEPTVPRLTPPPQSKGHSMRTINENLACSPDLAFSNEAPSPSVSLGFNSDGIVTQNEPSLMNSNGINDTFPLVQNQLPEPLKPTSVCSVGVNAPASLTSTDISHCSNLEKASATSPLSSELSTAIADVIQSLTSQHAGTQKANKESTASSNIASVPANSCNSKENVHSKTSQGVKTDAHLEKQNLCCPKGSSGSIQTPCGEVSPRSKMQTSVLDSMQSIVAEGCPEDLTLLEDISIDLSLDKDPSVTSVVLIDDEDVLASECANTFNCPHVNNGSLPYEKTNPNAFSVLGCFEKPQSPTAAGKQDAFLQGSPVLNGLPETFAAQQNLDPPTSSAEMEKSIDCTNPFCNKISQVQ